MTLRVVLVVLGIALAGCATPSPAPPATAQDFEDEFQEQLEDDRGGSVEGDEGRLEVKLTADKVNGSLPLEVNLTIRIKAFDTQGAQIEPKGVRWGIFVEEDEVDFETTGWGLKGRATVTIEENGLWTFIAGASKKGFATNFTELRIQAGEIYPPGLPAHFAGNVTMLCFHCFIVGFQTCVGLLVTSAAPMPELDCIWFELEPVTWGRPYVTWGPTDVDIEFRTACEYTATVIENNGEAGHDDGIVPQNSGCVILADWLSSGPITMDIY